MSIKFTNVNIGNYKNRSKRFFVFIDPIKEISKFVIDTEGNSMAYCPNNGKMADILIPGSRCFFSQYDGKLKWKWEAINIHNNWIGVNTHNPNKLIEHHLKYIFPLETFKKEVTFGGYRADFANENKVIEVKNVHWKIGHKAYFPDCVTERGARQLNDLINLQNNGYQCFVFYVLQRSDVSIVKVADFIDESYYNNHLLAKKAGIKIMAFNTNISEEEISIKDEILFEY